MDILARAIDKAQAELDDTLGAYIYWDCPMNTMLFETLGVTAAQFLEAVRKARGAAAPAAREFLSDARESPEDPAFLTDEQIVTTLAAPDVDASVVSWIGHALDVDRRRIYDMNERLETRTPSESEKQYFANELALIGTRQDLTTFADLIDLQEGRSGNARGVRSAS